MKQRLLSVAIASSLITGTVHAEDIKFSGFASIAGGMTTSSDEALDGFENEFDFKNDSFLALQASKDLSDNLGVTVQIRAKGESNWDPEFNWAFISYDATDNLRLLAGRQRIPFYMYSDFLDVSYAYPWITPSESVYGSPFDSFDGVSAIYNTTMGDIDANFHAIYGSNSDPINLAGQSIKTSINGMTGLAATFNYDWLTLRTAYFRFDELTMSVEFFDGLAQSWEQAGYSNIAQNTQIMEDSVTFATLGLQMQFDKLGFVFEYTELDLEGTPLPNGEDYYATVTYQALDDVLLHLTYDKDDSTPASYTASIPFGLSAPVDTLKGMTEGLLASQASENDSVTVGVRYDFHPSAALKVEYKAYSDDLNSSNDAGLFRVALVTIF